MCKFGSICIPCCFKRQKTFGYALTTCNQAVNCRKNGKRGILLIIPVQVLRHIQVHQLNLSGLKNFVRRKGAMGKQISTKSLQAARKTVQWYARVCTNTPAHWVFPLTPLQIALTTPLIIYSNACMNVQAVYKTFNSILARYKLHGFDSSKCNYEQHHRFV